MPDFERIVRERLRWKRSERREVVQELAGHLEDRYDELLRENVEVRRALGETLSGSGDWDQLRREMASARGGSMTERARHILIPGMVTLLIASAGERLFWQMRVGTPYVYEYFSWLTATVPMLCLLVLAGAAGAACSLYLGGNRHERIWAAELPALCSLATIFVLFVWSLFLETVILHLKMDWQHIAAWLPRYFTFAILLPAAALFVGALSFVVSKTKSQPLEAAAS